EPTRAHAQRGCVLTGAKTGWLQETPRHPSPLGNSSEVAEVAPVRPSGVSPDRRLLTAHTTPTGPWWVALEMSTGSEEISKVASIPQVI
ncbi:unnamed protein product, partial [Gulo gulo]